MSQWYLVKLELAPTEDFPKGSPGRGFLLRLPLTAVGTVDKNLLSAKPMGAFVRRFWPNEPDRSGAIEPNSGDLALMFSDKANADGCLLEDASFDSGAVVGLTDLEGTWLPFRVASVTRD